MVEAGEEEVAITGVNVTLLPISFPIKTGSEFGPCPAPVLADTWIKYRTLSRSRLPMVTTWISFCSSRVTRSVLLSTSCPVVFTTTRRRYCIRMPFGGLGGNQDSRRERDPTATACKDLGALGASRNK